MKPAMGATKLEAAAHRPARDDRRPALDSLNRFADIATAAWQSRHELSGPLRLTDERAFLPAVLSIQGTPPHPAPRCAAFVVCALFLVALAWATFGQLDVVAVASGRIIVSDRSKTIQPLETAIVRAIHVRDGDTVQAGQLLVELDQTASRADSNRLAEERRAVLGEGLRAQALLASLTGGRAQDQSPHIDLKMLQGDLAFEGWSDEDQAATVAQMQVEWQQHKAKLAQLDAEQTRRAAEFGTTREVVAKLKATAPIARQREADYRRLTEQGFMSSHSWQDRMRERIEIERDLATATARMAEVQASLSESRRNQIAYIAEVRRTWHDRSVQAKLKLAELAQEMVKAAQRQAQTRLTAPVAGIVQQLAIHTVGGVVTPAQALMVIVPKIDTEELIAEVNIENKDIGFIRRGQDAEVKFETFNYTRYGTVQAKVQWVAADAVVKAATSSVNDFDANKGGSTSSHASFPARLILARGHIAVEGNAVRLTPGLNVTAEVKTGRRTVIDYLLSPVQRSFSESFGER